MRILVLGAGGVGSATAAIARRRGFFDRMVLADLDPARAQAAIAGLDDGRFAAAGLDASDPPAIVELARAERADVILNACDPWLNPPIFKAALEARCTLDMAMTLSSRHPERPFEQPGVMLGDEQFAVAPEWEKAGRLALVGIGVEPGLSGRTATAPTARTRPGAQALRLPVGPPAGRPRLRRRPSDRPGGALDRPRLHGPATAGDEALAGACRQRDHAADRRRRGLPGRLIAATLRAATRPRGAAAAAAARARSACRS